MKLQPINFSAFLITTLALLLSSGCSKQTNFIPPVVDKGFPVNHFNPYKERHLIRNPVPSTSYVVTIPAQNRPAEPSAATVTPIKDVTPVRSTSAPVAANRLNSGVALPSTPPQESSQASLEYERILRAKYVGGDANAAYLLSKRLFESNQTEEAEFVLDYAVRHGHVAATEFKRKRKSPL